MFVSTEEIIKQYICRFSADIENNEEIKQDNHVKQELKKIISLITYAAAARVTPLAFSHDKVLPFAPCKYPHFSKNILNPPPSRNEILDTPLHVCMKYVFVGVCAYMYIQWRI